MDRSLSGAVLVSGAGRRIGRALAVDLAAHGLSVAVHYQSSEAAAQATVSEIVAAGGHGVALQADLSDVSATGELVGRAAKALGVSHLTLLVNNASVFEPDDVKSATPASWAKHMDVNLRAPFLLSQAFAAGLPESERGDIVNVIDQRVWSLTQHFTSYTLSKAGLWTLTRTLAMALAPRIRVNAIGPGPICPSARQSQEAFDDQVAATLLARPIAPTEICDAVRFILAAPAMTGQMIALDGGQHLGWAQPDWSGTSDE